MFKHILLPTDGSELSEIAVDNGIRCARDIHARVTGFHVVPEFHVITYQVEMIEDTRERFAEHCKAHAAEYLAAIEKKAEAAGVSCATAYVTSDRPYEAIIRAAEERGCDLILMASHGRSGVKGILLGSETMKVLTHSRIPVLVYR
jgi:nucleotide-binding universal stress UspA family protein